MTLTLVEGSGEKNGGEGPSLAELIDSLPAENNRVKVEYESMLHAASDNFNMAIDAIPDEEIVNEMLRRCPKALAVIEMRSAPGAPRMIGQGEPVWRLGAANLIRDITRSDVLSAMGIGDGPPPPAEDDSQPEAPVKEEASESWCGHSYRPDGDCDCPVCSKVREGGDEDGGQ